MAVAYLGGSKILRWRWVSRRAGEIVFSSIHDDLCHQVYLGRTLSGIAEIGDRSAVVQAFPSPWPQPVEIIAVDAELKETDLGYWIASRAWNRVKLSWHADSYPSDAAFFDVTGGAAAGDAVDSDNLIARVPYDTDREYSSVTPPRGGTGTHNFEIAARDSRGTGNLGPAAAVNVSLLVHPKDVVPDSVGKRLAVSVASGTATVTFTRPS